MNPFQGTCSNHNEDLELAIETSTFSADFMTMIACTTTIESLRSKLRMFGVPFEGPTHVYCDDERVVLISSKV